MSSAPEGGFQPQLRQRLHASFTPGRPLPPQVRPKRLPFCSLSSWKQLSLLMPLLPSSPPVCGPLCLRLPLHFCSVSHPLPLALFTDSPRKAGQPLSPPSPPRSPEECSSWCSRRGSGTLCPSWTETRRSVNLLFSSRRGYSFCRQTSRLHNPGQRG